MMTSFFGGVGNLPQIPKLNDFLNLHNHTELIQPSLSWMRASLVVCKLGTSLFFFAKVFIGEKLDITTV